MIKENCKKDELTKIYNLLKLHNYEESIKFKKLSNKWLIKLNKYKSNENKYNLYLNYINTNIKKINNLIEMRGGSDILNANLGISSEKKYEWAILNVENNQKKKIPDDQVDSLVTCLSNIFDSPKSGNRPDASDQSKNIKITLDAERLKLVNIKYKPYNIETMQFSVEFIPEKNWGEDLNFENLPEPEKPRIKIKEINRSTLLELVIYDNAYAWELEDNNDPLNISQVQINSSAFKSYYESFFPDKTYDANTKKEAISTDRSKPISFDELEKIIKNIYELWNLDDVCPLGVDQIEINIDEKNNTKKFFLISKYMSSIEFNEQTMTPDITKLITIS